MSSKPVLFTIWRAVGISEECRSSSVISGKSTKEAPGSSRKTQGTRSKPSSDASRSEVKPFVHSKAEEVKGQEWGTIYQEMGDELMELCDNTAKQQNEQNKEVLSKLKPNKSNAKLRQDLAYEWTAEDVMDVLMNRVKNERKRSRTDSVFGGKVAAGHVGVGGVLVDEDNEITAKSTTQWVTVKDMGIHMGRTSIWSMKDALNKSADWNISVPCKRLKLAQ